MFRVVPSTHHQERKQQYLQHLVFVTSLVLPAAIHGRVGTGLSVLWVANCSTCFGWYHHPSSGAQTTVSTASGICHTVTATCRFRGRDGTGLSVLWVAICSTCFGWYHHPSSGAQTTVSTASGICHTVTATCRYRGRE